MRLPGLKGSLGKMQDFSVKHEMAIFQKPRIINGCTKSDPAFSKSGITDLFSVGGNYDVRVI